MLAVIGIGFLVGGGVAYAKTQDGYGSLQAFSEAQNVILTYNEDGQLIDRGETEGAEAIMQLLTEDWNYPVVESDLDPNDPLVNTATEYMYQMATISYHTLNGTQTVMLDEAVEYNGETFEPGAYEVAVDGRYWTAFDREHPLEGPAREAAWSGTAHGLIGPAPRNGRAATAVSVDRTRLGAGDLPREPNPLVGHTESMEYVGQAPAPPLDRFIDDIYCLTGVPRHRRMNVPPMPSAHLFVNLGGPVRLWDSDPSVPPAMCTDGWFMGVWTKRFLFEYPTRVRVVGVHFKPWGMSPFVDLPATELRDRWVPVDNVWQRSLERIRNQVGDIASATETLRVLEEELRSRLAEAPSRGLDLVQHTGGRLETSHGVVPVGALADAAGVSGNHLATQFKSHVGVTPKRVARIYRFARLILSVDALRPVNWSELAQTAGYFDQAHFSREFKDFTGHTPTEYLALRRRFPAEQGFPPDRGPMPAD